MIVTLLTHRLQTLEQVRAFLDGTDAVELAAADRQAAYGFVSHALKHFRYQRLGKVERGLITRYLGRVTGLSRQQLVRLIAQFCLTGAILDRRGAPAKPFARRYTDDDTRLLAELDTLHGSLSGPTTRKLCERAFGLFGDTRYQRLAQISNGHLYNLRHSKPYQRVRIVRDKTRPVQIAIGKRRKPTPNNRPGYLRVDSVHQGDFDGIKGIYLINAVDQVTQFEVVCAVEKISERFLVPVLEALINAFPFHITGFHSDNGSEYINHRVAAMLNKLNVTEFTKSRARQTNDNALVESKNGSVVRKHLGYGHVPGRFALAVNDFTFNVLSPYLNFHRPCFFPQTFIDDKGRQRKRYPYAALMTPYEKLRSLPALSDFLKAGITLETLDARALKTSDNDAARLLNQARDKLFQTINIARHSAA